MAGWKEMEVTPSKLINLAMYVFTCGLLLMVMLVIPAMSEVSYDNETRLLNALLESYDIRSRPYPGDVTMIKVRPPTIYNLHLDETENTINMHIWLHMTWTDPRLQWDERDFRGISTLNMHQYKIWIPDLMVYNGINAEAMEVKSNVLAVVFPYGEVLLVSPVNVKVGCVVDLTYWPHDKQTCEVKIGSWTTSASQIDFEIDGDVSEIEAIPKRKLYDGTTVSTQEWNVTSWTMERKLTVYSVGDYVSLDFTLKLRREAAAYAHLIQVPTLCLSLLTIIVFLLPPSAPEKVTLGGLNLILNLMFFMFATHTVVHTPTHTPIIVRLLSHQLVLVMSSLFVAAIVVRVSSGPSTSGRFPSWFQQGLRGVSYALLLWRYRGKEQNASGRTVESKPKTEECESQPQQDLRPESHSHQWLLLGAVLDRVALLIYLIICVTYLYKFSVVFLP